MRSRHSCCDEKTWKATRMSIKIIPDGKRRTSPRRSCRTAGAAQGAHYARHPHPARWKLNIIRTENEPPSEDRRVPSDFWYQRGLRIPRQLFRLSTARASTLRRLVSDRALGAPGGSRSAAGTTGGIAGYTLTAKIFICALRHMSHKYGFRSVFLFHSLE